MTNKINLKEELNRILFLSRYKKGVVISEQNNENGGVISTTSTTVDNQTTTKTIKDILNISKSFAATYDAGDDDPSLFLENSYNQIIDEVNQKNPTKLPLKIVSVNVVGTASNIWSKNSTTFNGKKMPLNWTHYDYEFDFTTKNNNVDVNDSGYKNNKDLASRRANKFWDALKQKFLESQISPKISMEESLSPNFSTKVINSKGKENKEAQTIQITIDFKYENIFTMRNTNTLTDEKFATSTHWCDGTDGKNEKTTTGEILKERQCFQKNSEGKNVPATPAKKEESAMKNDSAGTTSNVLEQHHFITRFELFQLPVTNKSLGIWDFYWKDGKIYKINRNVKSDVIPKMLKDIVTTEKGIVDDIISDENYMTELLYCMNLRKTKTSGDEGSGEQSTRKSFNGYVEPYLA